MTQKKIELPILNSHASLIDTHCHLDMVSYQPDLVDILDRARTHGINHIVTIGIDEESSHEAITLAKRHAMISAAVGIHPHDAGETDTVDLDRMASLIETERANIVGYGEIGLDYAKKYADPQTQKTIFRDQLILAKDFNLPVIIHNRDADDDTLSLLQQTGPFDKGGIMHCFSSDVDFASKVLDLGLHISIPGIVTFNNASIMKEAAKRIPLQSLLIETDGPFLAPVPYRGKRNEPMYLLYTAAEIARLRDISLEELAVATTKNAKELFQLSTAPERTS